MKNSSGFTLVELAIVLTIIGLLVGGILAGQSIIRGSQMQTIISEVESMMVAIHGFNEKYKAMPGDMPNATSFWSEVSAGCTSQVGTPRQTCNGDGDEIVDNFVVTGTSTRYERFRSWQHLNLAGMIPNPVSGVAGSAGSMDAVPGQNVPSSRLAGGGYQITYIPASYAAAGLFATLGKGKHNLYFGGYSANQSVRTAILTTLEAYNLDLKFDDGRPGKGNIGTFTPSDPFNPACASSTNENVAVYNPPSEAKACGMMFSAKF